MASGDLKTSTPLQFRYDSGFGSHEKGSNILHDKLIELSPIRKKPSVRYNISAVLRVCNIFNKEAVKKWHKAVDKVSKKLTFSSSDVNKANSISLNIDSGIASINDSIENESLLERLTAFPTDENCNVIFSCEKIDKLYQPYKYICAEDRGELAQDKLCYHDRRPTLSKLLGEDASTDVITVQKSSSKFDLLHELYIRNCTCALSCILSYLSGEELRITSYVSKQWQNIILSDKNANERRKTHIKNKKNAARGPNKENRFQTSSAARDHKTAFSNVINVAETLPPVMYDNFMGRFDSFIEEVKKMKDKQDLKKCPKCHYPSKAQSEDKFCCTRKLCQHEFCKKCLGPYLDNHFCSVLELNDCLPNTIISSKMSRKNLRRL